jgi:adenine-specific DNA-methyltransferase
VQLRLPALLPGPGQALCQDAEQAAATPCDLAYLDPPYNQHSYLRNYHVWETLVRWDAPETYGIARKRADCRTRLSAFNSRPGIGPALARSIAAVTAPTLVVSFSDEGFLSRTALEAMLAGKPHLRVLEIPYGRYVGAKIGIHNPRGEKVGTVGRLTNIEYLFVASDHPLPALAPPAAEPAPA